MRNRIAQAWGSVPGPVMRWASVVLAVLAIAEAIFIGRLLLTRSATSASAGVVPPTSAAASAPAAVVPPSVTPSSTEPVEPQAAAPSVPLVVATATVDPKVPEIRTVSPPAPPVRTGGVRLTSPIELTVLDGDRVIGSSADSPIFTTAGRRELEFVNVRTHADTLRILQRLRVEDRLRLTAEHFMALPSIVRATDLAVLIPTDTARTFAAAGGGFSIVEPPVAGRDFTVSLYWSRRFEGDAGNGWLRGVIRELFSSGATGRNSAD